jgi:hypothetical protein
MRNIMSRISEEGCTYTPWTRLEVKKIRQKQSVCGAIPSIDPANFDRRDSEQPTGTAQYNLVR